VPAAGGRSCCLSSQEIADAIYALATGANQQFRTLVGQTGKDLMALRRSATIEEYLSTIAANFA
jgi:hypothetical protein